MVHEDSGFRTVAVQVTGFLVAVGWKQGNWANDFGAADCLVNGKMDVMRAVWTGHKDDECSQLTRKDG